LQGHDNFGIAGAVDQNNPATMTLSFSARKHIEIFGWYWPPEFKNWYSDNWAQQLYGKDYTFHETVIRNTQKFGQRYNHCSHGELMQRLLKRDRKRILQWLKAQPNQNDEQLTKKIQYYTDMTQGYKK